MDLQLKYELGLFLGGKEKYSIRRQRKHKEFQVLIINKETDGYGMDVDEGQVARLGSDGMGEFLDPFRNMGLNTN